jgi:hypothetical protein
MEGKPEMSKTIGTRIPDRLARFLNDRYGLLASEMLNLTVESNSEGFTEITVTLLVPDADLQQPRELVRVPILKYGDTCRHGFLTYTIDGDTFHRATLGRCTDAPASPRQWPIETFHCAHCTAVFDVAQEFTQHITQAHKPPTIPM